MFNKTRQGYAHKRTLKPAGYFFLRDEKTKRPFTKPATHFQEQVAQLQERGMVIDDPNTVALYLQHLNYYRLGAYWLPFEADHGTHTFHLGTQFSDVLNLYIFDRELRLLVLDAIERIEVSVRSQWAYQMAHSHGAHSHLDHTLACDYSHWESNLRDLKAEVGRSKETFIQHLTQTYCEDLPPIWAVCEVMSLGLLSYWYKNLRPMPTRQAIANVYDIDHKIMESWLGHLNYVRNICAHHSRLWNRAFTITLKLPRSKPAQLVSEFIPNSRKLYNTFILILHFLDVIAPNHHWRQRLKELLSNHGIPVKAMDFPNNWKSRPIWQGGKKQVFQAI